MPSHGCWPRAEATRAHENVSPAPIRGAVAACAGMVVAGLLLTAGGARVAAAPFCIRTPSVPSRCLYVDPGECRANARAQGGECVANPAEPRPVNGTGRYCIVVSGGALECEYPDRSPCERAAARMGSGCVEAPRTGSGEAPLADPFRAVRPY